MFINGRLDNRLNKILLEADTLRSKTKIDLQQANDAFNRGELGSVEKLRYIKGEYLFDVNDQMQKLRRKYFNTVDKIKEELMTEAFAPTAEERAEFRDVYMQLLDVTDKAKLEDFYQNCIRFNDTPGQKAVVARAADIGVDDIIADYRGRDENFNKNAEQYAEFSQSAKDMTNKFAAKMRLTDVSEPPVKKKDIPWGFTFDARTGDQVQVFRPFFYYDDYDKPTEEDIKELDGKLNDE
jgi:hypothetical protein